MRTKQQVEALELELASFDVHPEYESIADEANELTVEVHRLVNGQIVAKRKLELYEKDIDEDLTMSSAEIVQILEEARGELSADLKANLSEAQAFHEAVTRNRTDFLDEEAEKLRYEIENADLRVAELSASRAKLLQILETKHALSEFNRLNERLAGMRAALGDIESRISRATEFGEDKAELEIQTAVLTRKANRDLANRESDWSMSIETFAGITERLYGSPGELIIDLTDAGFRFDVKIDRAGSHGVESMKIFAFDLMLAERWAKRDSSPRLLWHDSELFDGVDERQIGTALQLASEKAEQYGFQYFCSLNSDDIPADEYLGELALDPVLTLSDDPPEDALFGMRF